MKYDLAALVRRQSNPRRSSIPLRPVVPTDALASDLYAVYRPIVDYLTGKVPALVEAYGKALPPTGTIHDSADDMRTPLQEIADYLNSLVQSLAPDITTWAQRVAKWHAGRWRGAVLSGTGVDLDTILMASGEPQSVGDAVAWNARLIKDVSDQAQHRISSAVFAAYQARKPAAELAREIREAVAMSRTRSLGIAADQTAKLSGALDRERATDAGLTEYRWRHSHKAHPRPLHVARDGKTFRYDDPPSDGPPGTQPWCGCRAQAKITLSV